jgi:hypothetical protein
MDRDLLIRFEVPYSQKEAKGVCYTMSRVQEANCNSWLDMRVVRDGVFQTVVSVAYSEGKVVRLKMAQSGNSGKLSVRISPVHRND